MDCQKIGLLIYQLRKEKNMTQKQLADLMGISDRTISKWERGLGCPDVSLLNELSQILNVNIDKILLGDLENHLIQGGNMKKIKFYVCPQCGNIITSLQDADISCCGRKLSALKVNDIDEFHQYQQEKIDGEDYIIFDHEMTKEQYISFVAYVRYDQIHLVKLYPEQSAEVNLPGLRKGTMYCYCVKHGLMKMN